MRSNYCVNDFLKSFYTAYNQKAGKISEKKFTGLFVVLCTPQLLEINDHLLSLMVSIILLATLSLAPFPPRIFSSW